MASGRVRSESPLVVIVGPTASGKTGLAIELASRLDGEIIAADSRTIYRGLTIGTAKPSLKERRGIPHWGFDLVDPGQRFTAVDFQEYARAKISEISSRGRLPILVGGTGLYVDAVIYNYGFPKMPPDYLERRGRLEGMTVDELLEYCMKHNVVVPSNDHNKRHIINNILRNSQSPIRSQRIGANIIVVGITTNKDILRQRIIGRVDAMFNGNVVKEYMDSVAEHGDSNEALTGNVYSVLRRMISGELTMDEAKQVLVTRDWQLAKRQMTWFRRNPDVVWLDLNEALDYISDRLGVNNNSMI